MFSKGKQLKVGYRPDIDGIRAIAVLAVIFYHFNITGFSGGFVGVDIFFVISGYLITNGIVKGVDNTRFSFGDFYIRRTRRLIPALLFVITITYAGSFFILSPKDFASLSGSVVYALSGISNIFFWMQSDYFDNFSTLKPLLHTWSLSVELQFYLLWPLYLIVLCRITKNIHFRALAVFLFFIIFAFLAIYYISVDSSGAFYLTPFRMHEFAIGAIGAFINHLFNGKRFNQALYILGFFLVLYSIFSFDIKSIIFPGYYALIPCFGTLLMILSGEKTAISMLLSCRFPKYIGEISYSLYLVHWPIYVLGSYIVVFTPSTMQITLMLALTLILSAVVYYTIEKPFRSSNPEKMNGSTFSLACAAVALIVIVPSASSWANNGWEWRIPEEIRMINQIDKKDAADYTWTKQRMLTHKSNFSNADGKLKVLVIGDSQSADLINLLEESGVLEKEDVIARTVYFDCGTNYVETDKMHDFFYKLNALTIAKPDLIPVCKAQMMKAMNQDLLQQADKIYIAFHYQPNLVEYVTHGVEKIRAMTNAKVYVVGRKNLKKSSIEIINSFNRLVGVERFAAKFKDNETVIINDKLSTIPGVHFINMMDYICPEKNKCLTVTDNNKPIFYDPAHLTRFGAQYLAEKIIPDL